MNNEPVAWLMVNRDDGNRFIQMGKPTRDDKVGHEPHPLYTHPAKTLTDEEIDQTIKSCGYEIEKTILGKFVDIEGINMYNSLCGFARAILRKAQEK
jgi:hypothetical protein